MILRIGTHKLKSVIITKRNHSFCKKSSSIVDSSETVFSKKYIFSSVNKGAVTPTTRLAKAPNNKILIAMACLGKQ